MNLQQYFLAVPIIFASLHCHATLGGPETIQVLGYENKEHKLYLLRHFEDERGRLPQLYYYQLNSKTPEKLIEVKSLYLNPKTKEIDYDQDGQKFEKDLSQIQKRLTPLIKDDSSATQIKMINNKVHQVPAWHTLSEKIPQYTITYQLQMPYYESKIQEAISYDKQLKITQKYRIPNENKKLVIIQYLGIPMETGYNIEDPVLLLPKPTKK